MKKITIIFIILIFIFSSYLTVDFFIIKNEVDIMELKIEKGDRIKDIYIKTDLKYSISDKIFFRIFPKYSSVKSGTFEIKGLYSKYQFLNKLLISKPKIVKLTIPEGFTQEKILERIEGLKLASKEEMINALNEVNFPYYHEKNNFDGYLFPETYTFNVGVSPKVIAETILFEFSKRFPIDKIEDKKEFYNLLKLASIVEGETSKFEEKALVAGVFKKRLEIGMKLQSDATLKYVTKRQALRGELLNSNSEYNSYRHKGLPPTPINNPSYETIIETKNAKPSGYLYFFMDKKNNTYFSKTHEEHLRKRRAVN